VLGRLLLSAPSLPAPSRGLQDGLVLSLDRVDAWVDALSLARSVPALPSERVCWVCRCSSVCASCVRVSGCPRALSIYGGAGGVLVNRSVWSSSSR
jgi:hypothetical protein